MNTPADLRYATSHEWIRLEGGIATVGISDHAQEELTDVVFVELPAIGKALENRAPLVQDAILGHLNALPDRDFAEPNQLTLKEGLTAAVKSKVPEFPGDGILIPQLEVMAPDAPAAPSK